MLINMANRHVRRTNSRSHVWQAPAIGLGIGLLYGGITSFIDLEEIKAPRLFFVLDGILTVLLPAGLGALAGVVFNYIRRQGRTNRILSTQNAKLQDELLTHLLGSHILHEIRNPLHNLTAVLEGWQTHVPPEESLVVQRNLLRLQAVTNQLSQWSSLKNSINLQQPVSLGPWLDEFLADKVRPHLHEANINLEVELEPVLVAMCIPCCWSNVLWCSSTTPWRRSQVIRFGAFVYPQN